MKVCRTWLREHCTILLFNEKEHTSYMDCFDDPVTRAWIRSEIHRGNMWAWCAVEVQVHFKGFESRQTLGACSYESEAEFHHCDHFEQLVCDGVEEIASALEALALEHGLWEHDPITCVWCVVT